MDKGQPQVTGVPSPNSPPDSRSWHGFSLFWLFPALLAAYLLASGPLEKMADSGILDRKTVELLYRPIEPLVRHCPPLQSFLMWYIFDLWKCHFPKTFDRVTPSVLCWICCAVGASFFSLLRGASRIAKMSLLIVVQSGSVADVAHEDAYPQALSAIVA